MAGKHSPSTDQHRVRRPARRCSTAPSGWACRVPTSCQKQGKCKECMVEVTEGMECLSAPASAGAAPERELSLVVPGATVAAVRAQVRCHTMRRGQMRSRRGAGCQPAVDCQSPRSREPCRAAGSPSRLAACPADYGIAMDLGTTTVVLRLLNLGDGRTGGRRLVRESAALRRVRRDGAHSVRHARIPASCCCARWRDT